MINLNIDVLEEGDKVYEVVYRHDGELTTFGIREVIVGEVEDIHRNDDGSFRYFFRPKSLSFSAYSSEQFNDTIFFDRPSAKARLIELKKADSRGLI